jgi:hypothetical protein
MLVYFDMAEKEDNSEAWTRTDSTQWHMQPHGLGDISLYTKLAYKAACNSGTSERLGHL